MKNSTFRPFKLIALGLILCQTLFSCLPEEYADSDNLTNIVLEPNLTIALGSSTYKMDEFLTQLDSTLAIDKSTDGNLSASYEVDAISIDSKDLISIEDQSPAPSKIVMELKENPTGIDLGTVVINDLVNEKLSFGFDAEGDEFSSILLNKGQLSLSIQLPFEAKTKYTISFPGFVKDEEMLEKTFEGTGTGATVSIDLAGYEIKFVNNQMIANFSVDQLSIKSNDYVSGSHNITASIELMNLEIDWVKGKFSPREFAFENNRIALDMFESGVDGLIEFADPKVELLITHNLGANLALDFDEISGTTANGTEQLIGTIIDEPTILTRSTIIGEEVKQTISISNENSDLTSFLSKLPNTVLMDGKALIGDLKDDSQFLTSQGKMDVKARFKLPFDLVMKDFKYTISTDTDPIKEGSEKVEKAQVILDFENKLPIDLAIQLYILDKDSVLIDGGKFFKEGELKVLESAEITNGRPTASKKGRTIIPLSQEIIDLLDEMEYLNVEVSFNTKGADQSKSVIFNTNDFLKLQLSIQAKTSINLND